MPTPSRSRSRCTLAALALLAAATGCSADTSGRPPLEMPSEPVKVCATIAGWPVRVADDACVAAGARLDGCPVDSPEGLIRWWSIGAYGYDGTPIGSPIDYQYLDSVVACQTATSQPSALSGEAPAATVDGELQ